jgi:hypothetical protein
LSSNAQKYTLANDELEIGDPATPFVNNVTLPGPPLVEIMFVTATNFPSWVTATPATGAAPSPREGVKHGLFTALIELKHHSVAVYSLAGAAFVGRAIKVASRVKNQT